MTEDTGLLQEIDDAVRVERLQRFWERSGALVIVCCAGIVLMTIASVLWKNHTQEMHARETDILLRAETLSEKGAPDEALPILEQDWAAKESGPSATRALIGLRYGEALVAAGQNDKALAIYSAIGADREGDAAIRNLAALEASILAGNEHKATDITPLTTGDGPFRRNASELKAARLLESGRGKEAAMLLQTLADDATLTASARARAMELLDIASEDRK